MDYLHVQADNSSYNYYLSHSRSRRLSQQRVFAAARTHKVEALVKACTCIREAIRGYSLGPVMGQYSLGSLINVSSKIFRICECAGSSKPSLGAYAVSITHERIQKGGGQRVKPPPPPPGNHKLLFVSLEILVRTPPQSNPSRGRSIRPSLKYVDG